jgi:hypothetical protein
MKTCALLFLAIALAGGCEEKKPASRAAAPPPGSSDPSSGTNAAPEYEAAWAQIPDDLNLAAGMLSLSEDGQPEIVAMDGTPEPDQGAAWGRLTRMLERDQEVIGGLLRAAAGPRCDFGLKDATAEGPDFQRMITIGGSFRKSARLLRADAARAWLAGDPDGAAARVGAIFRMGGHLAEQGWVLQSLVSAALIELACETARTMSTAPTPFPGAARQRVLDAIGALDTTDPAGLARARQREDDPDQQTGQQLDRTQGRLVKSIAGARKALRGE